MAPVWAFWPVFLTPSLFTLFFGVIVLGGWAVGAVFIMGALTGEAQAWRFSGGRLYVQRRSPFIDKTDIVSGRDVESVFVREIAWESGPHTFAVVIRIKSGQSYESRGAASRDDAEALAAHVRAELGVAPD